MSKLITEATLAATVALSGSSAGAPPTQSASPAPSPSATPSGAADPCGTIITVVNRPTVTSSVCTVRPRRVVLDTGYTNTTTTGSGGGSAVTYPQAYLQIGTTDPHFEFDITPPSENKSSLGGIESSGSGDVSMGAKYELGYGPRWVYGVSGAITYPTGQRTFSAGNAEFTGNFNWSYSVNSVIGLAGTMSFNAFSAYNNAGVAQSYFALVPTLLITASLPGPSEFFGEYAYFSPAGVNLGPKSLFDFGYIRDLGPRVQLDTEYGFAPTPVAGQRTHYVGGGISVMI